MKQSELDVILEKHKLWLDSNYTKGERANLHKANLSEVSFYKTNLREANLTEANLREAYLIRANLSGADLREAHLYKANLREANLIRADLYNPQGKTITTFQQNKDFAYHCDGVIKIGCISLSTKEWLDRYKEIGDKEGYSSEEIEAYGDFIKLIYNKGGT